jgi:hypothetical protein
MPGKRVTDHQVIKYKQYRQQLGQEAAAAKVGISARTGRRLERLDGLPSQRAPRDPAHIVGQSISAETACSAAFVQPVRSVR